MTADHVSIVPDGGPRLPRDVCLTYSEAQGGRVNAPRERIAADVVNLLQGLAGKKLLEP